MPLNAALQGKTYGEVRFTLGPDRVAAFAKAIDHRAGGVPPTFATAAEHAAGVISVIADDELGLDFSRVVHGDQTYEWRRPMRIGETLSATTTIESIRSRGGMGFLALRTDLRGDDGGLVVVARSTLLVRGSG